MKPSRVLVGLVALTAAVALAACGRGELAQPQPGPSANAAPLPSRVSASIATDHGPGGFIVGPDAIYVGNHRGGSIQRIDPTTNRVTSTVLVGGQLSISMAADPSAPFWACTNVDGALHQIDVTVGRVTASMAAECDGGWLNVINGQVWAVSGGDQPKLRVIDAKSAQVLRTAPLDQWSGPPILAGGRVLIGSGKTGVTYAFDPAGGAPAEIHVETPWLWRAGGKLYRMPSNGQIAELDPTTLAVVKTYAAPAHEINNDPAMVADESGHLYYRPD